MTRRKRHVWVQAAVVAAAIASTAAASAAEDRGFAPLLLGNGPAFCGPCEPAPLLTGAAPGAPVVALRYRWSAKAHAFELASAREVGATDDRGELRFGLEQGQGLDKVVVEAGDSRSDGVLFLTNGDCGGPLLCPLPIRVHVAANASAYEPGQGVVITVSGGEPGRVLDVSQEEYVAEGDSSRWVPVGEAASVRVDAHGHAAATVEAASPGVYRAIARDRETGEESGIALFEVDAPR